MYRKLRLYVCHLLWAVVLPGVSYSEPFCGPLPCGKTGDDILYELQHLQYFQGLGGTDLTKKEYYFSPFRGSDSNDCTKEYPCQTMGKMTDVCLDNTTCTLACGETFSPLVLTMDAAYDFQKGETVTWNAGADTGVIVDTDPANKIIVIRETAGAGTDPDASDIIVRADAHAGTTGIASFNVCGEATTINNNTIYYGPGGADGSQIDLVENTSGGQTCDINAAGSAVVADEDELVYTNQAFKVVSMVCRNEADANAAIAFTLLDDTAATTPPVTCTIADNERDCVADIQTTAEVAAGSKIAISAASTGDIADANGFVCQVFVTFDTAGGVASVTDTLGTGAADGFTANCGAGEPCILVQGECYDDPPLIDCNDTEPNGDGGVLRAEASTNGGEVWFQNIQVDHCNADGALQVGDADAVFLNVPVTNVVNVEGGQEAANGITSHTTGDIVYLNGKIQGTQDDNASKGPGVALTSNGNHTIITPEIRWDDNDQAGGNTFPVNVAPGANGADATIIGAFIHGERGDGSNWYGVWFGAALYDTTITLCKTTIDVADVDNDAGIGVTPNQVANDITLNLYETSVVAGDRGIVTAGVDNDSTINIFGRGVMFYDNTECSLCFLSAATSDSFTVDIEGIYDESKFTIDSTSGRTVAQVNATATGTWDVFQTNSVDPDGANEPWDNTAGTLAMPQFAIHPNCGGAATPSTCYDVAIDPYVCPLAKEIPKEVLNTEGDIRSLQFTGTIGGR